MKISQELSENSTRFSSALGKVYRLRDNTLLLRLRFPLVMRFHFEFDTQGDVSKPFYTHQQFRVARIMVAMEFLTQVSQID